MAMPRERRARSIMLIPHIAAENYPAFTESRALKELYLRHMGVTGSVDSVPDFEDLTYEASWGLSSVVDAPFYGNVPFGAREILHPDHRYFWQSKRRVLSTSVNLTIDFTRTRVVAFLALKAQNKGRYCPKQISIKWKQDSTVIRKELRNTDDWQLICDPMPVQAKFIKIEFIEPFKEPFQRFINPNGNIRISHVRVFCLPENITPSYKYLYEQNRGSTPL